MISKPNIPEDWRTVRLGEVVRFQQGGTPSKARPEYWDGAIPFVTGADLKGTHITRGDARSFLTKEGLHSGATAICERGALLLATRTRVGLVSIAGELMGASQDITLLAPTEEADRSYLCRTLINNAGALQQRSRGTTIQGVSREDVDSLPILLPPLREQRAIAAVLDTIDDSIERTEAVIEATEQLRDSLLHELLTRGVPGWHSEWKNVPGLGTIPAAWDKVRLGEVSEVNPRRPRLSVDGATPVTFLPMSAIAENSQGIIDRELRPYAEVSTGYTYFEENDLLFSKITPCLQNGKHTLATGLEGEFGFGTTEFHVVRANARLTAPYLFRVLTQTDILDRCAKSFTGTAGQQRVQPEILNDLPFPLPPLPEQQGIAGLLDGVDVTIAEGKKERDKLQSLRESVADALLTGRVRV